MEHSANVCVIPCLITPKSHRLWGARESHTCRIDRGLAGKSVTRFSVRTLAGSRHVSLFESPLAGESQFDDASITQRHFPCLVSSGAHRVVVILDCLRAFRSKLKPYWSVSPNFLAIARYEIAVRKWAFKSLNCQTKPYPPTCPKGCPAALKMTPAGHPYAGQPKRAIKLPNQYQPEWLISDKNHVLCN